MNKPIEPPSVYPSITFSLHKVKCRVTTLLSVLFLSIRLQKAGKTYAPLRI